MISITASTAGSLRVEATDGVNTAVMDESVDGAAVEALRPPAQGPRAAAHSGRH